MAALAVHDALARLAPALAPRLRLKWPNDVLADGAKLAGILIEGEGSRSMTVVIGIGVNVRHHPSETEFPATDVAAMGADLDGRSRLCGAVGDHVGAAGAMATG